MSKTVLLKITIAILCMPLTAFSRVFFLFKFKSTTRDLEKCIYAVKISPQLPSLAIELLIVAEDHRNAYHRGVDPIALLRCIVVFFRSRAVQGGSTIEQQFVRTITKRNERTFLRKLHEQLLALALVKSCSKYDIASAYLYHAYYGSGESGETLIYQLKHDLTASTPLITQAVARLKYPKPYQTSSKWHVNINNRINYINSRRSRLGFISGTSKIQNSTTPSAVKKIP